MGKLPRPPPLPPLKSIPHPFNTDPLSYFVAQIFKIAQVPIIRNLKNNKQETQVPEPFN